MYPSGLLGVRIAGGDGNFLNAALLLTSAYPTEELARYRVDVDDATFLAEPFTPGTLARRVRELLSRVDDRTA